MVQHASSSEASKISATGHDFLPLKNKKGGNYTFRLSQKLVNDGGVGEAVGGPCCPLVEMQLIASWCFVLIGYGAS